MKVIPKYLGIIPFFISNPNNWLYAFLIGAEETSQDLFSDAISCLKCTQVCPDPNY